MKKLIMPAIALALLASTSIAAEKQILDCTTVGKGTLKVSIIETAIENRFAVKYTNPTHQVTGSPLTAIVSSDLKKDKAYFADFGKVGPGFRRDAFSLTWQNGKPIATIHSEKLTQFLGAGFDYCENLTVEQGNKVEHAMQVPVTWSQGREMRIVYDRNTTPAKIK